jgi:hypothetical protein
MVDGKQICTISPPHNAAAHSRGYGGRSSVDAVGFEGLTEARPQVSVSRLFVSHLAFFRLSALSA